MNYEIVNDKVESALQDVPSNSFDAILCDPPYGINFMSKKWDYDVPSVACWKELLRLVKPGGYLMSFAGSRTQHRMAVNIEDAGFEIRDCLLWLYAKAMPKSQNVGLALDKHLGVAGDRPVVGTQVLSGNAAVSLADKGGTYGVQVGTVEAKTVNITAGASDEAKAWQGYGTALKPNYEPIILARKPLIGTMAVNVLGHGVGGLNIDGCRVGSEIHTINTWDEGAKPFGGGSGTEYTGRESIGRWPGNVMIDEESGQYFDELYLDRPSNPYRANVANGAVLPLTTRTAGGVKERGKGISRFFFSAKVNTKERDAGCDNLPRRACFEMVEREEGAVGVDNGRAGAGRTTGARNHHPTMKPIELCKWLATLIQPPSKGRILIPFSGSGSEMIGAALAGWNDIVGIEQDAEYVEIAKARLNHWVK